jgi:hypothetical protein
MSKVGRLAFREEGNLWNAYWASVGTMEDAILLASVNMQLVKTKKRHDQFLELVREMAGDLIEEHAGVRPTWPEPEIAPEHERGGNA